jgi:hypothetical protein
MNNFLKIVGLILVVGSINTNANEGDLIKNLTTVNHRYITIVKGGFVCASADSYKKLVDYVNGQFDNNFPSDCLRIKEDKFVETVATELYRGINIIKVIINNKNKFYWVAKTLTK